jgi:DNA polymerase III delta prime subunit
VGGSRWRAFPAQEAIAAAARAIRDDLMVTHCGRADCLRCNDAVAGGPLFQVTGTSASAGPPGTVSGPEAGPDRPERLARRDEAGHRGSGPSGTGGPTTVPVLLITGPVGVGKTTTAMRAGDLLAGANRPHAVVDFDGLASCYPPPADDPYNSRLAFRNLAAVWANYAAAGAERLIIARVIEARHELEHYRRAVPGADITVVRLRASDETLRERVLGRRVTTGPRAVRRALALARLMDERRLEHHLVETSGRSVAEVAKEVLRQARWL